MVLILGIDKGCPEGVGTLELHLNVSSFAKSFEFVSSVGDVGNNNGGPVLVAVVLAVVGVAGGVGVGVGCMVGCLNLCSHWSSAQLGNWQCVRLF